MIFGVLSGIGTILMVDGCTCRRECDSGSRPDTVKVLQFNIWLEGTRVDNGFEKIIDVIIASDADVVTFSEVHNSNGDWHERVLNRLQEKGYTFFGQNTGGDVGLISRYPILKTDVVYDGEGSIRAYYLKLPAHDQPILVCSAHLDYKNYGLYLPRGYNGGNPDFAMIDNNGDGEPDPVLDVAAIQNYNDQSQKDEGLRAFLKYVDEKVSADTPIILAGDFNDGSHLDWTQRAGNMFDHHDLVIPWRNSVMLQKAGFIDAYRKVHPDEVKYPGVSWPSTADGRGTTSWALKSDERDRIDFVYYRNDAEKSITPVKAFLAGPRTYWVKDKIIENDGCDEFICDTLPWPTDHKGVLIEFEVKR